MRRNLTQQAAAVWLNTTQSRLSKVETGSLVLGLDELRCVAAKLSIPPERLGIVADRSVDGIFQRECSEEFLGNLEHDGNSLDPIDYAHDELFRSFAAARDAGDFRVFTCALVVEPLSLWVEALTVAVIEAPAFDRLFTGMVSVNDEGAAISTQAGRPTVGIPFTSGARELLRSEPLSPIARAGIELAWQHRHTLLAR